MSSTDPRWCNRTSAGQIFPLASVEFSASICRTVYNHMLLVSCESKRTGWNYQKMDGKSFGGTENFQRAAVTRSNMYWVAEAQFFSGWGIGMGLRSPPTHTLRASLPFDSSFWHSSLLNVVASRHYFVGIGFKFEKRRL